MSIADSLGTKMREIILDRIRNDKLALPSMPLIATKCNELLANPKARLQDVATEIERDPFTAASLLRMANSASMGGSTQIQSIPQAVSRLGVRQLQTFFMHLAMRSIATSRDQRIAKQFKRIWEHSVAVAIVSRDLTAFLDNVDGETAYQVGLLHDIGKPIVGVMLVEAERALAGQRGAAWIDSNEWLRIVQDCHRPVGLALAEKWRLPAEVQSAIESCNDYNPADRTAVSNVTRFANAACKQVGLYPGTPDLAEVSTILMIGRSLLGLTDEVIERVTTGLPDRITELLP